MAGKTFLAVRLNYCRAGGFAVLSRAGADPDAGARDMGAFGRSLWCGIGALYQGGAFFMLQFRLRLRWALAALGITLVQCASIPPPEKHVVITKRPASVCSVFIPDTTTGVGASCLPADDWPTLSNPQDPAVYNADPTGVTDSTGAVAAALANGDVLFNTPGTYLINGCTDCRSSGYPWSYCTGPQTCSLSLVNGIHGLTPPAGRKIACAPGVILEDTITTWRHDYGMFWLTNSNNYVVGCTFKGANSNSPAPLTNQANGVSQIAMSGGTEYVIEGNTFGNVEGDASISTFPENGITSNYTVQYNTFQNDPLYAFVIASQTSSGSANNNLLYDSLIGAEWDGCDVSSGGTGTIGTTTMTDNYVISQSGNCATNKSGGGSCGRAGFEAEAYSNNATCDYSGLIMGPGNYCTGTAAFPAFIYGGFGGSNRGAGNLAEIRSITPGSNCSCSGIRSPQTCPTSPRRY